MKPSLLLVCVVGLVSCIPRDRLRKGDSNGSLEPLPAGGDGGGPSPPLMLHSSLPLVRHHIGSHELSKRGQFLSTIKNKSKWMGKNPKYSKVTGTRKTDSITFLKFTDDDQRKDEKSPPSSWEKLSSHDPVNHKYTKRGIKDNNKFKKAFKQKPWARYSKLNTIKETDENNEDLINSEYSDSDDDDEKRPLLQSQRKNWRNSLNSQRQRSSDVTKKGFLTTFKTKAKNLFKKKPRDSNQHYSKLRHSKPDRSTEMDSNERDNGRRYHNAEYGSSYEDEDNGYKRHRRKREDHNFLDRTLRSFVVLSSHVRKNMNRNTTSLPADTVTEELNKGQTNKYLTEDLSENQEDEGEEHQNENLNEDQAKEDKVEEMTENLSEDHANEDESKEHEGQEDEYEAEGEVSGLDD